MQAVYFLRELQFKLHPRHDRRSVRSYPLAAINPEKYFAFLAVQAGNLLVT